MSTPTIEQAAALPQQLLDGALPEQITPDPLVADLQGYIGPGQVVQGYNALLWKGYDGDPSSKVRRDGGMVVTCSLLSPDGVETVALDEHMLPEALRVSLGAVANANWLKHQWYRDYGRSL